MDDFNNQNNKSEGFEPERYNYGNQETSNSQPNNEGYSA